MEVKQILPDIALGMISSFLGDSKEGSCIRNYLKNSSVVYKETIKDKNMYITKKNGVLHSFGDVPIMEYNKYTWYENGKIKQRGELPNCITQYLRHFVYEWLDENFKLHRENLPAFIDGNYKAWYTHGVFIRAEYS